MAETPDLSSLPLFDDVKRDITRRIRETGIGSYVEAQAIAHDAAMTVLGDVEDMARRESGGIS